MRVYIAAPWKHKSRAAEVKQQLQEAGLTVTSRWMDFKETPGVAYEYNDDVMRAEALNDIEDVAKSTAMLYLNLEKSEGKATELGMALAYSMPIYVIGGKQNNVFLHLPEINHINSVEEFLAAIGG
jgi:hypothetical protein